MIATSDEPRSVRAHVAAPYPTCLSTFMPSVTKVTHARRLGSPSMTTRQSKQTPIPQKTPRGAAAHGGQPQSPPAGGKQRRGDALAAECDDWLAIEGECQTFTAFDTGSDGNP